MSTMCAKRPHCLPSFARPASMRSSGIAMQRICAAAIPVFSGRRLNLISKRLWIFYALPRKVNSGSPTFMPTCSQRNIAGPSELVEPAHAPRAATRPRRVMNSRRFTAQYLPCFEHERNSTPQYCCVAGFQSVLSRLWVKLGHCDDIRCTTAFPPKNRHSSARIDSRERRPQALSLRGSIIILLPLGPRRNEFGPAVVRVRTAKSAVAGDHFLHAHFVGWQTAIVRKEIALTSACAPRHLSGSADAKVKQHCHCYGYYDEH